MDINITYYKNHQRSFYDRVGGFCVLYPYSLIKPQISLKQYYAKIEEIKTKRSQESDLLAFEKHVVRAISGEKSLSCLPTLGDYSHLYNKGNYFLCDAHITGHLFRNLLTFRFNSWLNIIQNTNRSKLNSAFIGCHFLASVFINFKNRSYESATTQISWINFQDLPT